MPDYRNPQVTLLQELLNRDSNPRLTELLDGMRAKEGKPVPQDASPQDPAVWLPRLPPKPGRFLPDPTIIGNPRFARSVEEIFRIAPNLRSRVTKVSTAPTDSLMRVLARAGIDPIDADTTTAQGLFGLFDRDVWVRNERSKAEQDNTLGHELAHSTGLLHDDPRLHEAADLASVLLKRVK